MNASFFDYLGWVSLSPNLHESFDKALRLAHERGHQVVRAEHLLHALVDDPEGAIELSRRRIDRNELRNDLKTRISELSSLSDGAAQGNTSLRPDRDLKRLMAHASDMVDHVKKDLIDGGDVIWAMFELKDNHATQILKSARRQKRDEYSYEDVAGEAARAAVLPSVYSERARFLESRGKHKNKKKKEKRHKKNKILLTGTEALKPKKKKRKHKKRKAYLDAPAEVVIVRQVERGADRKSERRKSKKTITTRHDFDDGLQNEAIGLAALPDPELREIRNSLDAVLAKRKVAEDILNSCEWYHLLKNLNRVSGDLSAADGPHKERLVRKAEQEINKRSRCRKAYLYIQFIDEEIGKMEGLNTKDWELGDFDEEIHEPGGIIRNALDEHVEVIKGKDAVTNTRYQRVSGTNYGRSRRPTETTGKIEVTRRQHVWTDETTGNSGNSVNRSSVVEKTAVSGANYGGKRKTASEMSGSEPEGTVRSANDRKYTRTKKADDRTLTKRIQERQRETRPQQTVARKVTRPVSTPRPRDDEALVEIVTDKPGHPRN